MKGRKRPIAALHERQRLADYSRSLLARVDLKQALRERYKTLSDSVLKKLTYEGSRGTGAYSGKDTIDSAGGCS
jgi:hypothetical protein